MLRHGADIPAGYLGDVLGEAGVPVATAAVDAGAPLPEHLDWSGVVSLGGVMGAYQEAAYPFLAGEKRFLRRAADAGLPVLGICLGCQLLADALGGRAFKADEVEMGLLSLELTAAGREDEVIAEMDGPVLVWHEDTWEAPPDAVVLADSDRHPQAFRLNSALGMQPHPEVSPQILAGWLEIAPAHHFEQSGMTPAELAGLVQSHEAESRERAGRMFGAWVDGLG